MREKILFDKGWKFCEDDIQIPFPNTKDPLYVQAKTECCRISPAAIDFPDGTHATAAQATVTPYRWLNVDLPHDFIISQQPKEEFNNTLGYFEMKNAWYRKHFRMDEGDRGRRITLLFEGIATHATVYLNGCLLKRSFSGYSSFEVDISDFVDFEGENVLAVFVETQKIEGWWYAGGGIYRHVWMIKTAPVCVDLWGVYIKPQQCGDRWSIAAVNTLRNDDFAQADLQFCTEIFDGEACVLSMRGEGSLSARTQRDFELCGEVRNPHLWSLEDPKLYRAVTRVFVGGEARDEYETRFGFRTFAYSPESGLTLNGKRVFINGVCAHQDFGLTGKAVPDNIHRYKIQMLKEMGANGYRCSHYPHAEATMDALDELGFIVMDECRWFSSSEESMEQLRMLVKRDRNRPSVLFWSIGNEEYYHTLDQGKRICKSMMAQVRQLDDTRYVMTAVDKTPDQASVFDELDAIGINYNLDKYAPTHEKYPNKMIFASECCATGSSRGWYTADSPENGYRNAEDCAPVDSWYATREKTWKFLHGCGYVVGGYQWIGIDHRGETFWPRLCSLSGAIDMFLQRKDAFYQNQSFWIEDRPILHLLPHWNFEGLEGEAIDVVAYSNCERVELFLNGVSLGARTLGRFDRARWTVPYQPGELKAVGERGGARVIEEVRRTTGKAVALKLRLENDHLRANGRDIALFTCYCVDDQGHEVPDASPYVRFACNEMGKIVGTGSDECDHAPVNLPARQMRAGRISVAVQLGEAAGTLKLYAKSETLKQTVARVEIEQS